MGKKIKSIMLIDEKETDLFTNQEVIKKLNFTGRIQTFSDPADALSYLKLIDAIKSYHGLFAPQIILLAINMSNIDGFTFLDEFEKLEIFKQKPISIFILSSSVDLNDINAANNNKNINGFISKPLTEDKLMGMLDKIKE